MMTKPHIVCLSGRWYCQDAGKLAMGEGKTPTEALGRWSRQWQWNRLERQRFFDQFRHSSIEVGGVRWPL